MTGRSGSGPPSDAEAGPVWRPNQADPQLVLHRTCVAHIDCADFELQGDYGAFRRRRHAPLWGAGHA